MNTSSSTLKQRVGGIALLSVALTTGMWAGSNSAAQSQSEQVQPKRQIALIYPYEMLIQGKTGWAETNFVVDYAGRPLFTTASGSSDPAFAKAAIAMIEASEFAPVKKDRRATMAQTSQRFNFPGETSLPADARRVLNELRKPQPSICNVSDLDERPKALRQDVPVYPRAMKDDGLTGQVEIEFIVTANGDVVFPRIISASHEDFGWAAAAAVAQWRFQPPMKNGQKVDAKMTVPILFDARRLAAAE
ncbi:MAG: energy transducer TonB [Nibricoccus sp.]